MRFGAATSLLRLPALGDRGIASGPDIWKAVRDDAIVTPKALFDAAAPVAVTYAATITLDLTTGFNFEVGALTGNLTLANPSAGMTPGRSGAIGLTQDGTGSRILTLGSYWKAPGGAPVLSTAASSIDTLFYYVVSATVIRCNLSKAFA